ncbi:hypothetical protein E3O44_11985 [Cryobacterium algoricola]|uniref:Asp23/Gls24 family envelope stress response protein n=1 Tax=Cryobacterium algoricola TaxID=1259183 RepID=A0ABY2IDY6_9MICO|nr:hypothetical protein [Cryobacterium algoricola]TFB86320.1 hypothetical protein E3O44_11985 [Cryobacterium algoricola]
MTDTTALAADLETAVRAVPGVSALYPTAPLLATIVGAVVDAITTRTVSPALVSVSNGHAGLSVSTRIGVTDTQSAVSVSRLVYDTIAANPAIRAAEPIDTISVTVASID